ncbi:MAG: hypothetical protein ACJ8DZ_14045 [Allosphingosinicella sp.]
MTDYSHFAALDVTAETTREYTFDMIPGEPSIILAPAHDSNEAFLNERLRMQLERAEATVAAPRGKKAPKATPESLRKGIEEDRDFDRKLIANTCARGWGVPPKDKNGKSPEFSPAECYDFLNALPDWMFDPLRNYAANIYNFIDRSAITGGADALGNS